MADTGTLEMASVLCGQASWKIKGQDHASHHPVATPDMIRQLPAGFALVIRGGNAPVISRLPRAWNNPAYRRAHRHDRGAPDFCGLPFPESPEAELWPEQDAFPETPPPDRDSGDSQSFPWNRP
jgi:hypothetical protein